ncbi:Gfo/Idh/MocA family oxidoreductase [Halapricum hydrolyticum]|uniref:Gfo/Idh/MocA family oxidoreductase n=1 Tax=Halapricum hydrolyticum TaxID=2979991 RepID=A0AAE3LFD0_9EURY|nr:Gfo/Idh/MocA family oxidoreductase [Halapricum hydrolyticum]MCU4718620.1 Gfo/Idh/MocA family oxidoreductase [Halapricum hydrolyticum]MCU4727531.1 Gfo/Idh/MocA family oxidoreductase [Halapricum hydrolyticum]
MTDETLAAGVYGVGQMGSHHARVYEELPNVDLVGVYDNDPEQASSVAADHGTSPRDPEDLFERVDVLSIAVPTAYHYDIASRAIDSGVHVLVEKPFVETDGQAETLIEQAEDNGVVLQVGHIERFNPAVRTLQDVVPDLDVIAVDARRLGPPLDRDMGTGVALDLMLHDLDVVLDVLDVPVRSVTADGTEDGQYVTALVTFEDGVIGTFTASRLTQQKIRKLSITARSCKVDVDYIDRSVHIYRKSYPEFVEEKGSVRYRYENLIEQPMVENGEPLKNQLESFTAAVRSGEEPIVTGEDGRRALALANRIEALAAGESEVAPNVTI